MQLMMNLESFFTSALSPGGLSTTCLGKPVAKWRNKILKMVPPRHSALMGGTLFIGLGGAATANHKYMGPTCHQPKGPFYNFL